MFKSIAKARELNLSENMLFIYPEFNLQFVDFRLCFYEDALRDSIKFKQTNSAEVIETTCQNHNAISLLVDYYLIIRMINRRASQI